jgi:hypothetical protein
VERLSGNQQHQPARYFILALTHQLMRQEEYSQYTAGLQSLDFRLSVVMQETALQTAHSYTRVSDQDGL